MLPSRPSMPKCRTTGFPPVATCVYMLVALAGRGSASGRDLTYAAQGPVTADQSSLPTGPPAMIAMAPSDVFTGALAPDVSTQTTDLPNDLSLVSAVATNSSGLAIESLLNTYNPTRCQTSCNTNCQAYTAANGATLNYNNYIQADNTQTCGCGLFGWGTCTSYKCCIQVCDIDSDCPSSYFCQQGYPYPIGAACTKCDACGITSNAKCQADQSCTFPCCLDTLNSYGGCYTGVIGSYSTSPDACCPSDASSRAPYNYNKCSCLSQQTCPSATQTPTVPTVLLSPAATVQSPPPPPKLTPSSAVPSAISTAATIPVVTARQTLSGFTVATFDVSAQAQFVKTLAVNIQALSGPVNVSIIPGSIVSGSVVVGTSVQFLNGDSNSAASYVSAMKSSSSSVFGSYSASVSSTTQTSVANPNAQTASASNTVSGVISLDTSSVSASCKSLSLYQCVRSYKVDASGSAFTLTSTPTSSSACGVGQATFSGTVASGEFPDGTEFTANGETTYISVNVANGVCVGTYHVTSGGPILGVSTASSSAACATTSLVALFSLLAISLSCILQL